MANNSSLAYQGTLEHWSTANGYAVHVMYGSTVSWSLNRQEWASSLQWFHYRMYLVQERSSRIHLNDLTSKVVMGPLEKNLYTSIEMKEKRVKMIFKECYFIASHYGALNEIKDRCLFTALQTGFYIVKTYVNPNMAREMFPPLMLDLFLAFKLIMLSPSSRAASCHFWVLYPLRLQRYHRLSDLMFCDYLRDKHLEVSWGDSSTSRPLGIGHFIFLAYLTSARSDAKSII